MKVVSDIRKFKVKHKDITYVVITDKFTRINKYFCMMNTCDEFGNPRQIQTKIKPKGDLLTELMIATLTHGIKHSD